MRRQFIAIIPNNPSSFRHDRLLDRSTLSLYPSPPSFLNITLNPPTEKQETSENGCSQHHFSRPTQEETKSTNEPTSGRAASEESILRSENNHQYLTGLKLVLVMSSVIMAVFLILLDSAIISTVSQLSYHNLWTITTFFWMVPLTGLSWGHRRLPINPRYWLVCQRRSLIQQCTAATEQQPLHSLQFQAHVS